MPAFIFAIFLSAFLLFQVQPIVARFILPWFGGSPAVWTTCMLFFQVGLLAGYTWAHILVSWFRGRPYLQVGIQVGVLFLSFLLLPITPDESLKPKGEGDPTWGIVLLLAQTVGLPYVLISASGPLLQSWFGHVYPGRSPYRLYAVSNAGSLLGLISYPFVFEPLFGVREQTMWWSWGYAFYAVIAGICGWLVFSFVQKRTVVKEEGEAPPKAPPVLLDRILWVAFAACGSVMLIATTNQMCQDVAVVPLLWVLPLGLYLITFIIAFDREQWYQRLLWIPLMVFAVSALVYLLNQDLADVEMHLGLQVAIYMFALFTVCMVCHGEMVRLKPDPHYLTSFYLAVSLGGAIGGALVSLVAPRVFDGYWELHTVLVVVGLLLTWVLFLRGERQRWGLAIPGVFLVGTMGYFLWLHMADLRGVQAVNLVGLLRGEVGDTENGRAIVRTRGFYGALRVYEEDWGGDEYRALYHGRINHGMQFTSDVFRYLPATYYTESSGVGVLFDHHPARQRGESLNYACVGLGIGTLATHAKTGDRVKFYEINDQIEEIARSQFTYLADCPGDESVAIGDARITLERELEAGELQNFDMLFVDAFSGDSIPIHLLTRESFDLYFKHLKPDGVLVVHITNLHLDLSDPVRNLAAEFGREAVHIEDDVEEGYAYYSDWVIITKNEEVLSALRATDRLTPWWTDQPKPIHWTDDYSNLLEVIVWKD